MTKPIPNKPIPTKFDEGEDALIRVLSGRSGLPVAQIIRRCVRLMGAEQKRRGRGWNWIEETVEPFFDSQIMREAAEMRQKNEAPFLAVAEPQAPYGDVASGGPGGGASSPADELVEKLKAGTSKSSASGARDGRASRQKTGDARPRRSNRT